MCIELEAMVANTLAESGEAGVVMEERREEEEQSWPSPDPADIVFRSSTSRYFCGEGRSNSPFGTAFYNFKQHTLRTCKNNSSRLLHT